MIQIFITAILTVSLTLSGLVVLLHEKPSLFGSFTEVNSTDRQTDFPTTYNANLAKTIEVGTTSVASITTLPGLTTASALVTVGTITSGTWHGNAIEVAYQGTGSTSPMANYVMLGAGASGLKTVNGLGTLGQFLTSAGAGVAPTWTSASFDLTQNYLLTGQWNWTASSTFNNATTTFLATTSIIATSQSPLRLNGLNYNFPDVRAASNTVLTENGSGSLTWNAPGWELLSATSTTYATTSIPLTVAGRTFLRVYITWPSVSGILSMTFNGEKAGTTYGSRRYIDNVLDTNAPTANGAKISLYDNNTGTTSPGIYTIDISNVSAVRKFVTYTGSLNSNLADLPGYSTGAGVWNNTSSQITKVELDSGGWGVGTKIYVYGSKD